MAHRRRTWSSNKYKIKAVEEDIRLAEELLEKQQKLQQEELQVLKELQHEELEQHRYTMRELNLKLAWCKSALASQLRIHAVLARVRDGPQGQLCQQEEVMP